MTMATVCRTAAPALRAVGTSRAPASAGRATHCGAEAAARSGWAPSAPKPSTVRLAPISFSGLGGKDLIRGRDDDDCLIGGSGKDRLLGGPGHDRLTGGTGADVLVGGSGVNRYDAGAGNDVVNARNGRAELVSCGSGRDRARVDRSDRTRSCERVERSP